MHTAYTGETFEQSFKIYDARDKDRRIDSATYEVEVNGETVQSGAMTIEEDGHIAKFRFNAETVGIHTIKVTWRIGSDIWKMPFLMEVRNL